ALVTMLAAMLDKRAIGRDAGARADHDDGCATVLREPETVVAFDEHGHLVSSAREITGSASPVLPAELLVSNYCYGEMRFPGIRVRTRSNGVQTRRQPPQRIDELLCIPGDRVIGEQVDNLPRAEELCQAVAIGQDLLQIV